MSISGSCAANSKGLWAVQMLQHDAAQQARTQNAAIVGGFFDFHILRTDAALLQSCNITRHLVGSRVEVHIPGDGGDMHGFENLVSYLAG